MSTTYARRRAAGTCPRCGVSQRAGTVTCAPCRARSKAKREREAAKFRAERGGPCQSVGCPQPATHAVIRAHKGWYTDGVGWGGQAPPVYCRWHATVQVVCRNAGQPLPAATGGPE